MRSDGPVPKQQLHGRRLLCAGRFPEAAHLHPLDRALAQSRALQALRRLYGRIQRRSKSGSLEVLAAVPILVPTSL